MEVVSLKWRGPYECDRLNEVCQDWGIYAICRKWAETDEKILYIGETYFQEIPQRLSQHGWWLNDLRGNVRIRFAEIVLETGSKHSHERTKDIEALLIYNHQPKYNIQNRNFYEGRSLRIVNTGRHGPIRKVIRSPL